MRRLMIVAGLALGLAGCNDEVKVASIQGACDAFDAPTQPVLGKRRVDQLWIDKAVEAGISACGWDRPRAEKNVSRAVAQMR